MNGEKLVERRKWFRVFPEGTLEFLIITRVLALMMMMALAIVGGTQRPTVLIGLIGILWIDYALLLWWVVQVAMDLRFVAGESPDDAQAGLRARVAVTAILPSIAAAMALLPWDGVVLVITGARHESAILKILPVIAALGFIALLLPAYRALRSIGLGSSVWTVLLLIPVLHFVALHRIAGGLDVRIREQLRSRGLRDEDLRSATASLITADVIWVLTMLPWAAVVVIAISRGWPAGGAFKIGPISGTLLAAVFSIANLAALESVQRQIVALVRKS